MSFTNFIKELNGKRIEGELLASMFYSLLTSSIFLTILYFITKSNFPSLIQDYGYYLAFSALSYAIIMPSLKHVGAYKELPCMNGMMIGMTMGMISSFLVGFYVAGTNGMFIGGFFGVLIGASLGMYLGKCCGVMGSMEGIMAGFMGGLMGAMTAFMLINDHLKLAGILVFFISAIIITKLHYMVYIETKEREVDNKEDFFKIIFMTFILMTLTSLLILFGPRSALFA